MLAVLARRLECAAKACRARSRIATARGNRNGQKILNQKDVSPRDKYRLDPSRQSQPQHNPKSTKIIANHLCRGFFAASNKLYHGGICLSRKVKLNTSNHVSLNADMSPPSGKTAALIFLHGLGDRGSSWEMELAPMLPSHIKCICPTAPEMPVTMNMGMQMNSWFDLRSLNPDHEDSDGIKKACKDIHKLIADQEKHGISSDRIILGGFSQGGALSLYSALTYPKKLAGAVALSCWLPLHEQFPNIVNEANKNLPLIQCHGQQDFIVPYPWAQASQAILSSFLKPNIYSFKSYAGLAHSSSMSELRDVLEFIAKHLPKDRSRIRINLLAIGHLADQSKARSIPNLISSVSNVYDEYCDLTSTIVGRSKL